MASADGGGTAVGLGLCGNYLEVIYVFSLGGVGVGCAGGRVIGI